MVITEDNELLFSVLFERDFLPQDAEALLGFKPNNGRHVCVSDTCVSNHYMGTQSIDAIERTFGTLILNTLAGAANDGDNPDMHVLNMQYFDATDNNIEFAKKYALGTAVRGVDYIDAFDPEKDARQFAQLMSLCNGLVICD